MQTLQSSKAEIKFSQEEYEEIEKLAGCNYTPAQIALFLDVDQAEFLRMFNVPDSMVRHHYKKGLLEPEYLISQKLQENAKTGNITAVETFEKRQLKVNLATLKQNIFNDGY